MSLGTGKSVDMLTTSPATVFSILLGTTPFKIADYSVASSISGIRRISLVNKSAAAYVTCGLSLTSSSPQYGGTTSFMASSSGTITVQEGVFPVLPNTERTLTIPASLSLWVVASGASTPFQAAVFDTKLS